MISDITGKNAELIQKYIETHDHKTLSELVSLNYPLVIKLSRNFHVPDNSKRDLLQEGCLGLIEGINKFDPSKGTVLCTYITFWIRAYMYKFLVYCSHITRLNLSTDESKLFYNLKKEQEKLKNNTNIIENELEHISNKLGIDLEKVKLIDEFNKSTITSFDNVNNISNINNDPDKLYEDLNSFEYLSSKLDKFKSSLNLKETAILEDRIISENPCTFEELGARMCISKQRVKQIEDKLKDKLQKYVKANYGQNNCAGV
jgi:RNA polymerase sigma-32 factor